MAFTVTWRGASGKSYDFTTYGIGTQFNDVSGVYVFCRPLSSGNWEALYVGETHSFKQRLNTGIAGHEGFSRASRLGMTHIAAMTVASDAERLRVETDLRHGLNPSANAQSVTGRYR